MLCTRAGLTLTLKLTLPLTRSLTLTLTLADTAGLWQESSRISVLPSLRVQDQCFPVP